MASRTSNDATAVPLLQAADKDYLHVRKRTYLIHFALLFLILSIFDVRVERQSDYGLLRVERLFNRHTPLALIVEDRFDPTALASQLDVRPDEFETAQYVAERYYNHLSGQRFINWSRMFSFSWGRYTIAYGSELFENLFFSFIFAALFYFQRRGQLAEELIVYQNRKYRQVHHRLESKMQESTRIIDKFNKLQDKLLEAEKLASIGRLSATLAHEIRNPLSIIKSSTEIVMEDAREHDSSTSAIELILAEVNRMDRIITDLLNFARPKPPNLDRHGLRGLVRHWLPAIVEELEKHNIQLVPQLENYDSEVLVDADQLWQVFLNTVWNARDALMGHPKAHVFIRTEDGGDNFVKLIIQDTGSGMLPDLLRQIKEPFFTTKTQGTGLGIPVSIQLIAGMGGRYEMTSELEYGTTVTLHLLRTSAALRQQSSEGNLLAHGGGAATSAEELKARASLVTELEGKN